MMLLILIINIATWDPSPLTPHVMHILTLFYTDHARSYITLLLKTVLFFFLKKIQIWHQQIRQERDQ